MTPQTELLLLIQLLRYDAAPHVRIPLEVTFVNTGPKAVRLLDTFTPRETRFFFMIQLARVDGTLVPTRGGGKVDLDPSLTRYKDLAPGDKFVVILDLVDFVDKLEDIAPGKYSVQATYFNQYGRDCFKGQLTSPKVKIEVLVRDRDRAPDPAP